MENKKNNLYQLAANVDTEDGNILYVAYLRYKKSELSASCINKLRFLGLDVNEDNYNSIEFTYDSNTIGVKIKSPEQKMVYNRLNEELFMRYCDKFSDKDLVKMSKIIQHTIDDRLYIKSSKIIELAVATNTELRKAVYDSKYDKITEQA